MTVGGKTRHRELPCGVLVTLTDAVVATQGLESRCSIPPLFARLWCQDSCFWAHKRFPLWPAEVQEDEAISSQSQPCASRRSSSGRQRRFARHCRRRHFRTASTEHQRPCRRQGGPARRLRPQRPRKPLTTLRRLQPACSMHLKRALLPNRRSLPPSRTDLQPPPAPRWPPKSRPQQRRCGEVGSCCQPPKLRLRGPNTPGASVCGHGCIFVLLSAIILHLLANTRAKFRLDDLTAPRPHLVNAPPQVGQLLQYGGASLLTTCRRLCRCRRRGWSTTPQT